jgi:hypothetical protein
MPARRITTSNHGRTRQRGAVLLIILVILLVGIAAVLINSLTAAAAKNARQAHTAAVLAQAKDALIGFAITYGDTHSDQVHGYLPCPDTSGSPEGSADPPCLGTNVSVIGRLPWATLDLSTLRDGDGECLWYAVSGTYKDNPKTGLMNWDTNGQLQAYAADGTLLTPADNQVVAVIVAPGAPLSGQDRSGATAPICGGNYTASSYLDSGTVNSINFDNTAIATGKFIQGTSGGTINDQMVFITKQDIWNAVQKRSDFQTTLKLLTHDIAACLKYYAFKNDPCGWSCSNDSLPWPAPLTLSDYADSTKYDDTSTLYAGRVPYNVTTSAGGHSQLTALQATTLMSTASCSSAGWTTSDDAWWNNWKDHFFYALSYDFKPSSGGGENCGYSPCLTVGIPGHNYTVAAVVMFANSLVAGQVRASDTTGATSAPRGTVSNYLEDVSTGIGNASSYAGATGNEKYYGGTLPSSTFNDVLCYLDTSLTVHCP